MYRLVQYNNRVIVSECTEIICLFISQQSLGFFGFRRTDYNVGKTYQGVQTPSQVRITNNTLLVIGCVYLSASNFYYPAGWYLCLLVSIDSTTAAFCSNICIDGICHVLESICGLCGADIYQVESQDASTCTTKTENHQN